MPYKKESPFASFRDPKRPTRNYNPTNFQMPDINAIMNKTADGEKVEEPKKSEETSTKDKVAGKILAEIEKGKQEKEGPITRKSLRQDRRIGEKDFNKELRRVKRLAKSSSKDITAKQRIEFERAEQSMREEKELRKEAKKQGVNPADLINEEGVSGNQYAELSLKGAKKALRKNPDDRKYIIDQFGYERGYDGDVYDKLQQSRPYKRAYDKERKSQEKFEKESQKEAEAQRREEERLQNMMLRPGSGMYNKQKNMKQINSKGSGFPMIQPNQNMAEPEQIKNRAGRSMESNILTNDPNINQPMNKVAGSNFQRNAKFNDIASGQGVYNPPQSTMPMPNQPMGNQTPQQQTFGQQGSFAAYSNPGRAVDTSSNEIMKAGKQMQSNVDDLKDKFDKKDKDDKNQSGGNDGVEFNAGLKKASAEGKLDNNPKFKAAVDSAPGMYDGPAKRSFKAFDHAHTKVTKGNLKATERDDAAHMSYLKRDIKYDNKHGGSKKQMLDDEKHISKLAGDLKYDAKKKRS